MEEVVVLEDLTLGGFETHDRFKSIEWEYAAASVEELAKLHGLSIAFQKEYPNDYEDAKQALETNTADIREGTETEKSIRKFIGQSIQMIREETRPRVQKLFHAEFNSTYLFNPIGKRMVIIHGDFKQTNLMHKTNENKKLQVITIDYQTLRPSCAAGDLLHFVFNCADGKFRKQYYHQLMDHYYEHMTAVLRRLHLDPEEVFPRADFDEDLKEMMLHTLIHSVITLPIFYVEPTDVRQLDPNESIESMTSMVMNPSDLCVQRLNEIVDDCVRWGVI